jgi:hypothetical protein
VWLVEQEGEVTLRVRGEDARLPNDPAHEDPIPLAMREQALAAGAKLRLWTPHEGGLEVALALRSGTMSLR